MEDNEQEEHTNDTQLTLTKLSMSADYYASLSPHLSRFYMSQANNILGNLDFQEAVSKQYCVHCGSVFRPHNHRTRFRRQVALCGRLRRIYRRANEPLYGKQLGAFQRHLVAMHQKRTNRVLLRCLVCRKETVFPVPVREKVNVERESTPQAANLTKRQKKRLQQNRRLERFAEKGMLNRLENQAKDQGSSTKSDSPVAKKSAAVPELNVTSPKLTVKKTASQKIPPPPPPTSLPKGQQHSKQNIVKTPHQHWVQGLRNNPKKKKKLSHNTLQHILTQAEDFGKKPAKVGLSSFLSELS